MSTDPRKMDYVKSLHLKQVGIALASLWVIVLIAAVAATIYREIDGPIIRSTMAENINLVSINSTLNDDLGSARNANDVATGKLYAAEETMSQLSADLQISQSENASLYERFASYFLWFPLIELPPNAPGPVAISSFP